MNQTPACPAAAMTVAQRLLPEALWQLPLARLQLDGGLADQLAGRGLLTPDKDGKRDIFRVPADLSARLQN